MEQTHWDSVWSVFKPRIIDPKTFRTTLTHDSDKVLLDLINDVQGKKILELGCGNGEMSVVLSKQGAEVTAIDTSVQAIKNVKILSEFNRTKIDFSQMDVMDIKQLNRPFDLIFGRFILHHIEPFEKFAQILFDSLAVGGRAIFLENNSRSVFLMFFRKYFVGRFGIPKHGDKSEHPFEPTELETLRKYFKNVVVIVPELMFFTLIGVYFFQKNSTIRNFFLNLDRWCYKKYKYLHKYSYRQIIILSK